MQEALETKQQKWLPWLNQRPHQCSPPPGEGDAGSMATAFGARRDMASPPSLTATPELDSTQPAWKDRHRPGPAATASRNQGSQTSANRGGEQAWPEQRCERA